MYEAVLAAMAADIDGDASAAYLPEGERERLSHRRRTPVHAGRREAAGPAGTRAFEERAAATPEAIAVVFDGVR